MARFSLLRFLFISALALNTFLFSRPVTADEGNFIVEEAEAAAEKAKGTVTEMAEEVVEAVQEAKEAAEDMAGNAAEEAKKVGEDVGETLTKNTKETAEADVSPESSVSGLKEKVKNLMRKVNSLDKAALKKIAAGAIGLWGASIAVGWLTKGTPSSGNDVSAPEKKRR